MMKAIWVAPVLALAMMTGIAACTSSTRTTESTGEYVDDAAITSKVKAAVLGEPNLHVLDIGVETYKDAVQLSGFVDTPQAKIRAGEVAAAVPGVRSVKNNLIVK